MSPSDLYSSITIRPAKTDLDIQKAINLRWLGYKKYETFKRPHLESLDYGSNCTILLAEDPDGVALGTIRILDRRFGPVELDSFIDIDRLMPYNPKSVAEATRFSIPASSNSKIIKHLLWKAYFNFCYKNAIDFMLISVKESARKDYRFLNFIELENGCYTHESLGNLLHFSYYLEVRKAPDILKEQKHPMYNFFCQSTLKNITVV